MVIAERFSVGLATGSRRPYNRIVMPARLSKPQQDKFLSGRHVAVLVTIGTDGSPSPTPIWYLYRDGLFYFRTASDAIKTKNIRRDSRVSICVQDERAPYKSVVVRGTAEVADALGQLERDIPRHYLGVVGAIGYRAAAREQIEQGPEVTLIVRPAHMTTSDFAADTPSVGRVWLLFKRVLPPWL
ncbi:MAG: PPOX class F420-dependent oxidoreductase [Chloroflexota bacterium]|nr:PPOX class F420-dependent oxidoreductase [Chloroflexota bacterium]